jgi:hypothetical protein
MQVLNLGANVLGEPIVDLAVPLIYYPTNPYSEKSWSSLRVLLDWTCHFGAIQ